MGMAYEVVNFFVTNPGAAPVATTPLAGDSATIRSFNPPARAWLVDVWGAEATAGIVRVRSPRLHDNVQGLRFRVIAATMRALLSEYEIQDLYAQDTLVVEIGGGAAESDGAALLIAYDDLPGADPRLGTIEQITPRIANLVNVEVAVGAGAAIGQYATPVASNATFDLLVANTDYALLGYEVDANGLSVGIRGIDTGNLRVGGPMTTERLETRDWFVRLNRKTGRPTIPILNSANKAGTLVDTAQVVAGVAANVTLCLAELNP